MAMRFGLVSALAIAAGMTAVPMAAGAEDIDVWTRNSGAGIINGLADRWNESNPDKPVNVTVIPDEQFVTKFTLAVAGGDVPDLVSIDLIYTPAFMEQGLLEDLTDAAKALPHYADLSPAHMRLGTWTDGRHYALPFNAEGSVLVYNKGLFEQAGLDVDNPPTTWAGITDAARAVDALGDDIDGFYFSGACAGCNAFTFMPLVWADGGVLLDDETQAPTLAGNEALAGALDLYKTMWAEGLVPEAAKTDNGANFIGGFTTGKVGMIGSGAFAIGVLKNDHPEIEFGLTYLPGRTEGYSSFAGGDNIGIPKGSDNAEGGMAFISWVLSDEIQLEEFAANGQIPVRTDLVDNPYFEQEPRFKVSAQGMAVGRTPYSVKYNALFNDPNGPWLAMLQQAIFQGDVDGAITDAQAAFERVLAE